MDESGSSVDANAMLFFQHEFIENGEYSLAITVHAPQRIAEIVLVTLRLDPFVEERPGHVDIAAQIVGGVSAQEESIENRRLSLGRERIQILAAVHHTRVP